MDSSRNPNKRFFVKKRQKQANCVFSRYPLSIFRRIHRICRIQPPERIREAKTNTTIRQLSYSKIVVFVVSDCRFNVIVCESATRADLQTTGIFEYDRIRQEYDSQSPWISHQSQSTANTTNTTKKGHWRKKRGKTQFGLQKSKNRAFYAQK